MELLINKTRTTRYTAYHAAKIFYLLFWVLKPFYLIKSGSMQLGDICLGISFLLVLYCDEMYVHIESRDTPLLFFLIAVGTIEIIYAGVYQDSSFIKPILYFIFNFMCVYVTRIFMEDNAFIGRWNSVLKFNLIVQLGIFLIGAGRWYYSIRYMGTYNDPNQLAFAMLSTYCLIYCLNRKQYTKYQFVYFIIALFLIFETNSVGMFFGITLIFVFEQYFRLAKFESNMTRMWYIAYLVVISGVFVYAGGYFLLVVTGVVKTDVYLLQRIADKLSGGSLFKDFVDDRNLAIIFEEPYRVLYGYGEGLWIRKDGKHGELHSTWLGLLYCYGTIPFLFLLNWIKLNLKKIDWYVVPVYISIFAEAFTLINHRQPSFWTLILLGSFLKRRTESDL